VKAARRAWQSWRNVAPSGIAVFYFLPRSVALLIPRRAVASTAQAREFNR
jgi:hypothetical protein